MIEWQLLDALSLSLSLGLASLLLQAWAYSPLGRGPIFWTYQLLPALSAGGDG